MPFNIISQENLDIGTLLIETKAFTDIRGYFIELYKKSDFEKFGLKEEFVQDNLNYSKKNVLRGLHYQLNPNAQGKLVTCLKGEVMDVVVDIRQGSPNFGKWKSYILSDKNKYLLYVPEGFAHGFLTLSEDALLLYKCTNEYSPENEGGIIWNDPDLGIEWGIKNPILIERDLKNPLFKDCGSNFVYDQAQTLL